MPVPGGQVINNIWIKAMWILSHFYYFLNNPAVYFHEINPPRHCFRFYNPSRDVEDPAVMAFGQLQGTATDGCAKAVQLPDGRRDLLFVHARHAFKQLVP